MSFRKRNIGLSSGSSRTPASSSDCGIAAGEIPSPSTSAKASAPIPGVRPSPLDGRPATSTGTPTLDNLLAGHAGLALGTSLLIEESGTTDFAGALLRYYAAEGVVQGHIVHVVGVGEQWGRELPGLVGAVEAEGESDSTGKEKKERMKIAWRYERLGQFGAGVAGTRGGRPLFLFIATGVHRNEWIVTIINQLSAPPISDRIPAASAASTIASSPITPSAFCHTFDLTKRLTFPVGSTIKFIPVSSATFHTSPFSDILQNLTNQLSSGLPATIHRLIIPTLLSPALYPSHASHPQHILAFLHSLRSILRQYPTQLTAMFTLPLSLYPRSTGLVRWIELLSDGVLELAPFPHSSDLGPSTGTSGAATAQEEQPQGMLKIHRLPVFHERGGGGSGGSSGSVGDDLAFTVSRRRFVIKPFSLPPVEGDTEAQKGEKEVKQTKVDIDF